MSKKLVFIALLIHNFAFAQENSCSNLTGQTISTTSFAEVASYFSELPIKDEFETTASFNARRLAIFEQIPDEFIILKEPEDLDKFEYDADTETLKISRFSFDNSNFRAWNAVYASGLYGQLKVETIGNIQAVISQVDIVDAPYAATNGFGAQFEVLKINRSTNAIFDRPADSFLKDSLFASADDSPWIVGTLSVTPEEARILKPALKLAFVVSPKEPYLFQGSHRPFDISIRNPRDIVEDFTVLVADIRCGLLLDSNNLVLASYPTR